MSGLLAIASIIGLGLAQSAPPEIPLAEYADRRERVREALGEEALLMIRGPREGHGVRGFRQSSDLYYLTGVEDPGVALMIDGARDGSEILFLPERSVHRERWEGPRLYPGEEAETATGIQTTRRLSTLEETLLERARGRKILYTNHRRVPPSESLPRDLEMIRRLRDRLMLFGEDPPEVRHVRTILSGLRQVKSRAEIARLRGAIDITCEGLREAMRAVEPGMFEYEIQAVLEYVFKRRGAKRTGFSSIVGSGPNSCILHYRSNARRTEEGDLVVVDVGAEYGHYTADVTRTFPVSGKFTDRQREIYEIVLEAQEAALEAVEPGARIADVHGAARKVIEEAGYGKHFLHGTSHWLGLDVHDAGERDRPLEPGMVFTVEPGIYLPDEEIGVRIEDDVLVTEGGYVLLSEALPRRPEAIEAIIAEGGEEAPVGAPHIGGSPPGRDD